MCVFIEVDFVNDFQGICKKVKVYVVLVHMTANRSAAVMPLCVFIL